MTLLPIAFVGVDLGVLGSRRDVVEHDHFRVPSWIRLLGVVVCAGLLTQREAEIWLRAGILLVIGLVLYAINVAVTRREAQ